MCEELDCHLHCNPFSSQCKMHLSVQFILGQRHHPVLTYSSQIHQTSPHSHHHHRSGRCPRCSVRMHTGTPPSCRWQLEHLMLTRESKKKHVRWQGTVQFRDNLLSAIMDWQVFIAAYLCMICITERNAGFASLKNKVKLTYKYTHADNPVNTFF